MSDLMNRLRALGIEPGEAVRELRAWSAIPSTLDDVYQPQLVYSKENADAALAEATQSELELCERVKGLKEDNERLQWMLAECIARGLMGGWHITDKDAFLEGLQARWVARLAAAEEES